jgi:hypothetical protein
VRAASGGVRACPGECGGEAHRVLSRRRGEMWGIRRG